MPPRTVPTLPLPTTGEVVDSNDSSTGKAKPTVLPTLPLVPLMDTIPSNSMMVVPPSLSPWLIHSVKLP